MIDEIRALFPIDGERFKIELVEIDSEFAATLRLIILDDGQIRDVKEQVLTLLPAAHRNARGRAFLLASVELAREHTAEQLEMLMPHDLFHVDLLDSDLELDAAALRRICANPRAQRAFVVHEGGRDVDGWSLAKLISTLDPARRPAPPTLRDEQLEAAILERPDDRSGYSIYGDWLAQHGDPRGELVAVQCALADRPDDAELREREARILDEYAYELLGDFAWSHEQDFAVQWRYGFPHTVRVGAEWDELYSLYDGASIVRDCARLPLVQHLVIGGFSEDGTYDNIIDAIRRGLPRGLRELGFVVSQYYELGELEPAYEAMAALDRLSIETRGGIFGDIDLPELRSFEFISRGLTRDNLDEFRRARWPKLERFVIAPSEKGMDNCDVDLDDLDWLFAGELAVTHLGLWNTHVGEVLPRLAKGALLPRLRTLDVSRGWINEADAAIIREHASALVHLEELVLPERTGFPHLGVPQVRVVTNDRFIPLYE